MRKIVEAPGVEGRGDGSGFRRLRGGSSGLAELRCSNEGGGDQAAAEQRPGADPNRPGADGSAQVSLAASDLRALNARLVALEHVLGAVGALLEAGAIQEALSLVRGWRPRG